MEITRKLIREKATSKLIDNLLPQAAFVVPPGEGLLCLVCHEILKSPVQLTCGHRICKSCEVGLVRGGDGTRYCPDDEEPIEHVFPDTAALSEIMTLRCYCLSQSDGCNWQGLVIQLEEHNATCEFSAVAQCPYLDVHCTFVGNKQKLEKHMREGFKNHDTLLATSLAESMNDFTDNQNTINHIKERSTGIGQLFHKTSAKTLALEKELNETAAVIYEEDLKANKIKEQLERLEEHVQSSECRKKDFIASHNRFKEIMKNVETQMNYITDSQREDGEVTGKSLTDTKKSLFDKVKRLGDSNTTHEKQLSDLGMKVRIFQCSSRNGDYTWKLDNLRNRFSEALAGKVDELYTPPLYTSSFGYKYSAKVMLYGPKENDKVNNNVKHIALYIVLMQGDYDEILKFPFPYPITITLLNTGKKADVTHTLYPDPNKVHFQKPCKNVNPAIGFSRFCSHDRLYSDGFVKNDALYFKIHVGKTGIDVNEPNI